MRVTHDSVQQTLDVVMDVLDAKEKARHERAVVRYQEERKAAAVYDSEARLPWWVDEGGEGEPCI